MLTATQTLGALYYNYYYTIPFRHTRNRHNNAQHVFFLFFLSNADQAPIFLFCLGEFRHFLLRRVP